MRVMRHLLDRARHGDGSRDSHERMPPCSERLPSESRSRVWRRPPYATLGRRFSGRRRFTRPRHRRRWARCGELPREEVIGGGPGRDIVGGPYPHIPPIMAEDARPISEPKVRLIVRWQWPAKERGERAEVFCSCSRSSLQPPAICRLQPAQPDHAPLASTLLARRCPTP
jgi:hypothetical protein